MTTGILLLTVPLWPLLLATLALVLRRYRVGGVLAVCGALPALAVSLMAPFPDEASYAWLLLGMRFGLGEADTIILLFTAVVWLLAGLFARTSVSQERRERVLCDFPADDVGQPRRSRRPGYAEFLRLLCADELCDLRPGRT